MIREYDFSLKFQTRVNFSPAGFVVIFLNLSVVISL